MGLGKTLVVLALIAGSLEDRDNAEVQSNVYAKSSRTTLVITPLSSRSLNISLLISKPD